MSIRDGEFDFLLADRHFVCDRNLNVETFDGRIPFAVIRCSTDGKRPFIVPLLDLDVGSSERF